MRRPVLTPVARVIVLTIVPVYVLFVVAGVVLTRVNDDRIADFEQEQTERIEADRAILVSRTVEACGDRNQTKAALRGTIDAALAGSGRVDLTQAPSFSQLPSVVQRFIREISARPSSPTAADNLRAYRATLVDENCAALGRELARELIEQDKE